MGAEAGRGRGGGGGGEGEGMHLTVTASTGKHNQKSLVSTTLAFTASSTGNLVTHASAHATASGYYLVLWLNTATSVPRGAL